MTATNIEWTDRVWNPVRGCSRVSEGCAHCYAEVTAHRFSGPGQPYEGLIHMVNNRPQWNGEIRLVPEKLEEPLHWKKPCRIFVNSMSDLFHKDVPDSYISSVFAVMERASQHQFQVLTKRPERMCEWVMDYTKRRGVLPNVWLGFSAENQRRWDERIAAVRPLSTSGWKTWVSAEPLLGPIVPRGIDILKWLVVGGESGSEARPFDIAWAETIICCCHWAGVPCFVKQLGSLPVSEGGVLKLRDRKGGDMQEWSVDLRIREFPDVRSMESR